MAKEINNKHKYAELWLKDYSKKMHSGILLREVKSWRFEPTTDYNSWFFWIKFKVEKQGRYDYETLLLNYVYIKDSEFYLSDKLNIKTKTLGEMLETCLDIKDYINGML